MAHKWAKWLRHPCRLGDPHRCRAGGKIRSGLLVGKVATSTLPSRGSPPLQSGGKNQKWPTCGQSGYVTPAVSGIPTASRRGGKSEMAHLWAKWLHHPCRLGDPHRFTAGSKIRSGPLVGKVATSPLPSRGSPPLHSGGGRIRSGPLVGKVATSPLPSRGSPPLQSGGGDQKWPTCGQSGYVTPAVSGIPTASERGAKSEVAHLWARWLRHPCRLGNPHRCRAGGGIRSGPHLGKVATSPLPSRGSPPLQSGGENQKWPTSGQGGYVTPAVSGIPTASQRGGNQKWPTCGQSGYVTPAVSGIPTAAERGGGSEVAHLWARWLRHPCRLGDPHRFRAGGKIRSGPLVGKVATSPLPSRGSPPLHSGGQNQKWPTSGQGGYVTPAVSGIPTAAERGGESEVAHLWAKWLRHPCRLGDPHRFRAGGGGGIRSGPLVGKVATSPLPSRGSPPLQSGGGNQKWPTCGQSGYVTPAVLGIPTASERGGKSEVAHLWAKWLRHPCRLGDPHRFTAGGEIRDGPLVGKVATPPVPSRGSPPLHSGEQNQKWPTCGQSGYVTPAVSGIPTAAERGGKSEVAHLWAKWLRHPCRLGDPHRFGAGGGGGIRSGPLVGKVATSPLPSRGSPPLQSGGGGNQKWPTCGQSGYVTPAVSGIPTASQRGGKIRSGPQVGKVATSPLPSRGSPPLQSGGGDQKWPTCGQSGYVTPAVSGIPTASQRGAKSEVAHKWARRLRHPCRLGDPRRCTTGGEIRSGPLVGKVATSPLPSRGSPPLWSRGGIRSGPQVGKVATSPLPSRGSPPLQSGGGNQKWPTRGQGGYVTPAVSGIPTASERGGNQRWPTCGQSGYVTPAVSGIPTAAERGGGNQKWPTRGQSGYVTPAVSGIPTASQRGGKSEVAHKWARWLRHPCRLGDPHRCKAGGGIRSGLLVGKVATSPLPSRGSPPLQSGGKNQKWPTCGQSGYVTPAVSGIPTASQRGGKSEMAHLWAKWLRHPCRLGDPHRFTAGSKIRSGPLVGKVATSPLPSRGSPPLQSGGGGNQKWPTCGQSGYVTPAVSGIPTASERGGGSEVAHLWAKWLRHPCRLGDPHRFRAGGKIRSGPLVGKVATSPLPSRGSPPLQSGGQNQKWPTRGQSGYVTPAVSGIPTASERGGGESEVAHKWAKWLRHPCCLGDPHRFRGGGGGNQKWPTCGQSGYVTPAVSGIPTATERGAKSEVGHLWAKWLRHPCRLGDPHRFTAGGQNQKWPTSGQSGYVTPAVSWIPTASERGAKSEVAHLWAKWLRHPCRLGDPHRFRAGGGNQKWPTCGQSGYVTPAVSGIPTDVELR